MAEGDPSGHSEDNQNMDIEHNGNAEKSTSIKFDKIVGSKLDRSSVIPDMKRMDNTKNLSRIYEFKSTPPPAFRKLMKL